MSGPSNRVTQKPTPTPPSRRSSLAAAASLVGPPLIWAVHFLFCYIVVSLACAFGMGNPAVSITIVTLIGASLLGLIGLFNARKWRATRNSDDSAATLDRFLSFNAMVLSVLSLIALIWVAFPTAVLPPCTSA